MGVITRHFFDRPATQVARGLIGVRIMRSGDAGTVSGTITEVEAYGGSNDLASHAVRGWTPRNASMFGPAGAFYIYKVYGLHWMLNIVTGPRGSPAAVLIRSLDIVTGPMLGVDGALNGSWARPDTGLWFEQPLPPARPFKLLRTPRVGVTYAGPVWSAKKLRFVLVSDV